MNEYVAHVDKNKKIQTVEEHSLGTATLAKKFADEFGCGEIGWVMGMLHDLGKYTDDFQAHIKYETGIDPNVKKPDHKVKHAYVGALKALKELTDDHAKYFVASSIQAHHAGLYNFNDTHDLLEQELPEGIPNVQYNRDIVIPQKFLKDGLTMFHFVHLLFSCLVDADFIDTESFMSEKRTAARNADNTDISVLYDMCCSTIAEMRKKDNAYKGINKLRNELLDECLVSAESTYNFNKLIVPTGAGKTFMSIAFALKKAKLEGKKHIIIATPYNSITSQTAEVYRNIFGRENVLEIDCNYDPIDSEDENISSKFCVKSENFDAPIIVTSMVQVIESMFSWRGSRCRKLHNLANSIVVIDEIQKLPYEFLQPIVDAFRVYSESFNTSFLFMSATEMPLDKTFGNQFYGLKGVHSIVNYNKELFDKFKRTNIYLNRTPYTYTSLANKLSTYKSVLCIVRSRECATEVYRRLEALTNNNEEVYCLTRNMCPKHVDDTINIIRDRLEEGLPVRVVSTSLVEAGVDFDFENVMKQIDGIDSDVQAAGRCNREGKREITDVEVFCLTDDEGHQKDYIKLSSRNDNNDGDDNIISINVHSAEMNENKVRTTKQIASKFSNTDIGSLTVINNYFISFFLLLSRSSGTHEGNYTCSNILRTPYKNFDLMNINQHCSSLKSRKVGEDFKLISDDVNNKIIVPYGIGQELIDNIEDDRSAPVDFTELSKYTVNVANRVRGKNFSDLVEEGVVVPVIEELRIYKLANQEDYDEKHGVWVS